MKPFVELSFLPQFVANCSFGSGRPGVTDANGSAVNPACNAWFAYDAIDGPFEIPADGERPQSERSAREKRRESLPPVLLVPSFKGRSAQVPTLTAGRFFLARVCHMSATCMRAGTNHTGMPAVFSKWHDLVKAFATHLVERYGIEEVATWNFEV